MVEHIIVTVFSVADQRSMGTVSSFGAGVSGRVGVGEGGRGGKGATYGCILGR